MVLCIFFGSGNVGRPGLGGFKISQTSRLVGRTGSVSVRARVHQRCSEPCEVDEVFAGELDGDGVRWVRLVRCRGGWNSTLSLDRGALRLISIRAGSNVVSSVGWGETWAVVSVALFGGHLQETGLATRQGSFGRVVPSASLPGRAEDGRLPCGGKWLGSDFNDLVALEPGLAWLRLIRV